MPIGTEIATNSRWHWQVSEKTIDLEHRGLVMGILNVTPDSFSDGGKFADRELALEHAVRMASEGAGIIDIGGESTRPGAVPVSAGDELARVVPVIEAMRAHPELSKVHISIDTSKATVAREALAAGANIINDVTGLRGDPKMVELAASCDAGIVVMHMQGQPQSMQASPEYAEVTSEVTDFFAERDRCFQGAGIDPARVLFDPGIGFGKTVDHNLELLSRLDRLDPHGRPLLLGVSRKSFIGRVLGTDALEDRSWPTVALTSYAREHGARVFRVHDVEANAQALTMTEAILAASAG